MNSRKVIIVTVTVNKMQQSTKLSGEVGNLLRLFNHPYTFVAEYGSLFGSGCLRLPLAEIIQILINNGYALETACHENEYIFVSE